MLLLIPMWKYEEIKCLRTKTEQPQTRKICKAHALVVFNSYVETRANIIKE